jgi:hypothetical protein
MIHRISPWLPVKLFILAVTTFAGSGSLRADTIILKSGARTMSVDGTISAVNAKEAYYTLTAENRNTSEPVGMVFQIKSPGEPELTAAEQAYADGKWALAAALYGRSIGSAKAKWATYRATVRLIETASKCQDLKLQTAGFVKLARLDPDNAMALQPDLKGVRKEALPAPMRQVQNELADATRDSKLPLLHFLADLHRANDDPASAVKAEEELKATELAMGPADFAIPASDGVGPHGHVFGNGGNARRIVFVYDGSGSMIGKAASLKNELMKTIAGLKPIQSFDIVFFQEQGCTPLDNTQLVMGDRANKQHAYKFLDDVRFKGTTDPIPGLKLAFELHPQLIYLVGDGDFADNKAVDETIGRLNADHKVKINTIGFLNNQAAPKFVKLLEHIAADNSGTYKQLDEADLNE